MSIVNDKHEIIKKLSETGLGTPVVHRCVTTTCSTGLVVHVVLPPRTPGSAPLSDLRDTGWTVEAVNPINLRGCSCEEFGTHALLSRSEINHK